VYQKPLKCTKVHFDGFWYTLYKLMCGIWKRITIKHLFLVSFFVVSVHPTTQYVRFTYLWIFFLWKILVCQ